MTHPQDTTPANPAQVTDAMVETAVRAYDNGQPFEASVCDYGRMRAALTAVLGAGGQAVAWRVYFAGGYEVYSDEGVANVRAEKFGSIVEPLYTHPTPSGQAVAVKALEWFKPDQRNTLSRAENDFGVYRTWTHFEANGRWFWSLDGYERASGECATEGAAKAAAQADYERRILSAIAHPVQPGWRDIESAPREHGHMILAPNRYGVVDTICWNDAANDCKGGWDDGCYGDDLPPYDPEIWMPVPVLPAAPQPKGE